VSELEATVTDTRPQEFIDFLDLLTEHAPNNYEPWLFRVKSGSKAPDLTYGSWKDESARMTVDEAVRWMKSGGNVGIAGRPDGPLVNVDIDDEDETTIDDLKTTLIARSRSRTGIHAWYFEAPDADIPNIPTDDAGEVRANWQYVVAPGSYVETDPDGVPDDERDDAGFYTIARGDPVSSLRVTELPAVFREEIAQDTEQVEVDISEEIAQPDSGGDTDRQSALFDIQATDVVRKEGGNTNTGDRWTALFHGSETGKNMSLSDKGLLHCWRHEVAHNGLQGLAVLSDYRGGCQAVGAGHSRSGAGSSCLSNEEGAHIWHAWKYAKRNGYLPDDDPVPYSALLHLCRERELCAVSELPDGPDKSLPSFAYDGAIESIRGHDDLDPGRKTTDEMGDDGSPDPDDILSGDADPPEDTADNDDQQSASSGDMRWKEIYEAYTAADDADARLTPRFKAAEQLCGDTSWRCLIENDSLWRYDSDAGIYRDDGDQRVRETLVEHLNEQFRVNEASEIQQQVRGRHLIREEDMGGPPNHIATENCVLELSDGDITVHDHDPEFEFIGRVQTPYDSDADCPRFRAFVRESVKGELQVKTLQEYAGYALMHWRLPHHKALFLVGPTASGKSTFLDTIRAMLGHDATASLTPQQMTGERFGGAELHGTWANIRNDIPADVIEDTGQFKEITAGDPIKAEEKYADPFFFEPTAKHMFSANQLPGADTDDEAFFRRILLVAFPTTVPRSARDPQLDQKLQAELPGILNWAIEGLQRLQMQGRFSQDRTPGQTQDTWEKWGNSVKRFAKLCLQEEHDNDISKSELHQTYLNFCDDEGIPAETQHMLTRKLKLEGFEDGRAYVDGDRQRAFFDIGLTGRGDEYRETSESGDDRGATGVSDF
jgi:P4 family phage/plasmid primase-like protien